MPNLSGSLGEALALNFLKKKGWTLLARNLRNRFGEIDLVMKDGERIVFVEVKSLRSESLSPEESIGPRKIRHLKKTALLFLQKNQWLERPARFDVVTVRLSVPQNLIEHFSDVITFP